MALEIQTLPREFRYNSITLPDPGAQFDANAVRDLYSATYPEIVNAGIEGPEEKDGKLVYTFRRAVGTKGSAGLVTVTMNIPADKAAKLQAFMASDTWEKEQAARKADLEQCIQSLFECVRFVRQHHANSTRFIASVLCSLYNGDRVKVDMSGIGLLDPHWAQQVINVIRLHYEGGLREPHTYFENGNAIFEDIIRQYRLEKRRRKS